MCSKMVRSVLKEPHRSLAIKLGQQGLKYSRWKDGKQGPLREF